jgi:UDPglucose 6-dehydrogenase
MKVCVIGTGYVGLTTGACLAFLGHDVTCVDVDEEKVELLRSGRSPIYEPYLDELLALAEPRLRFTTEYAEGVPGAEVVFVAVQTPSQADGSPDLQYLQAAAETIGRTIDGFTVVVNKSTVPIGSGSWVEAIVSDAFEERHGRKPVDDFAVASNPEFLREGSAIGDTLYPDRVVVGSDDPRSLEALNWLYRPVLDQAFIPPTFLPRPDDLGAVPLVSTDLASAELIKYAANAFLALKISYINEIGELASKVGADIMQVARGTGLDSRIGSRFLQPGIGWGGSCFGKDTSALIATAGDYGMAMPMVEAARHVNLRQRSLVVERLLGELRILKGRRIAILGLTFKPNTDDLRDSPSIDIARRLVDHGAWVRLHDPVGVDQCRRQHPDLAPFLCETLDATFDGTDAVVLMTEWSEYLQLDWGKFAGLTRTPLVFDGRHALDANRVREAGFRYLSTAEWQPFGRADLPWSG